MITIIVILAAAGGSRLKLVLVVRPACDELHRSSHSRGKPPWALSAGRGSNRWRAYMDSVGLSHAGFNADLFWKTLNILPPPLPGTNGPEYWPEKPGILMFTTRKNVFTGCSFGDVCLCVCNP